MSDHQTLEYISVQSCPIWCNIMIYIKYSVTGFEKIFTSDHQTLESISVQSCHFRCKLMRYIKYAVTRFKKFFLCPTIRLQRLKPHTIWHQTASNRNKPHQTASSRIKPHIIKQNRIQFSWVLCGFMQFQCSFMRFYAVLCGFYAVLCGFSRFYAVFRGFMRLYAVLCSSNAVGSMRVLCGFMWFYVVPMWLVLCGFYAVLCSFMRFYEVPMWLVLCGFYAVLCGFMQFQCGYMRFYAVLCSFAVSEQHRIKNPQKPHGTAQNHIEPHKNWNQNFWNQNSKKIIYVILIVCYSLLRWNRKSQTHWVDPHLKFITDSFNNLLVCLIRTPIYFIKFHFSFFVKEKHTMFIQFYSIYQ